MSSEKKPTEYTLGPPTKQGIKFQSRRTAGEKELKHPAAIIGDVAETVRSHLHKKGAKPPGLKTKIQPDGSMQVIAENPEVGLFVQVTISLLEPNPQQVVPAAQPVEAPALPGTLSSGGITSLGPPPAPTPGIGPTPQGAPPTGVGPVAPPAPGIGPA